MSSGKLEIKETCCPKMGIIKDTKVRDLDAKGKRWKDTDELYKKIQMNPIPTKVWSATQPDILECEVKWALGSTANKASGCDEIPVELFNTRCHRDGAFNMSANMKDPAVATGLEKVNPHPDSQEG